VILYSVQCWTDKNVILNSGWIVIRNVRYLYLIYYYLADSRCWRAEYEKDISWDRVTHIFTGDLPRYFAVLSRVHQQKESVEPRGAVVSSDVIPNVSVTVPPGSNLTAAPMTMEVR